MSEVQVETRPATAATMLLRAAEILEEYGWIQGCLGSREEGFCMLGAIKEADTQLVSANPLWSRALRDVGVPCEAGKWNDEDGRTKEEVVGRLRLAAALIEEGRYA